MRWQGRRGSSNVEDRRGLGGGGKGMIGGGLGIIIIIIYALLGGNPGDLINNQQIQGPGSSETYQETAQEKELAEFVSVVLADTEEVWGQLFEEAGKDYIEPGLVLYTGYVDSACGSASSATGPFYCPGDQKVYIDLSFYNELKDKFDAPGDFAMAYVIAHEVGHHVQTLLGINEEVMALQSQVSKEEFNQYMVKLELQADYLSGVWAHYAQGMGLLEEGDLEEALTAASAVGDDRIQQEAQGYVVPDSFTHGTSEQRMRWFKKGYNSGTLEDGDTFNAKDL
jgi:hypothetical protein